MLAMQLPVKAPRINTTSPAHSLSLAFLKRAIQSLASMVTFQSFPLLRCTTMGRPPSVFPASRLLWSNASSILRCSTRFTSMWIPGTPRTSAAPSGLFPQYWAVLSAVENPASRKSRATSSSPRFPFCLLLIDIFLPFLDLFRRLPPP